MLLLLLVLFLYSTICLVIIFACILLHFNLVQVEFYLIDILNAVLVRRHEDDGLFLFVKVTLSNFLLATFLDNISKAVILINDSLLCQILFAYYDFIWLNLKVSEVWLFRLNWFILFLLLMARSMWMMIQTITIVSANITTFLEIFGFDDLNALNVSKIEVFFISHLCHAHKVFEYVLGSMKHLVLSFKVWYFQIIFDSLLNIILGNIK